MSKELVHFLLVEDDDDHAAIVERTLKTNRIANSVDRVPDGEAALQYLAKSTEGSDQVLPDVILLDLNLPKVSGHEVLAAIKENPKTRYIPVVVLTTSDAETDLARAYQYHANSYVVKPVDFERFRQLVVDLDVYWGVWNRRT